MLGIIAQNAETQIDVIDLVTKVDQFYHNAWVKLIIVVSIAGFIVGIVVPAVIHWLQSRSFRSTEENFRKDMRDAEDRFEKRIESSEGMLTSRLSEKYDCLLEEKVEAVRKTVADELKVQGKALQELSDQVRSEVLGYLNHLKGGVHLTNKSYPAALSSYCRAAKSYLQVGRSEDNLQNVLKIIAENCLPNLKGWWFGANGLPELSSELEDLLEKLKEADRDGQYKNYIEDIEHQFRLAKRRKEVKGEQ